jgi:hypothetical protein
VIGCHRKQWPRCRLALLVIEHSTDICPYGEIDSGRACLGNARIQLFRIRISKQCITKSAESTHFRVRNYTGPIGIIFNLLIQIKRFSASTPLVRASLYTQVTAFIALSTSPLSQRGGLEVALSLIGAVSTSRLYKQPITPNHGPPRNAKRPPP